jgi:hypothetical protein
MMGRVSVSEMLPEDRCVDTQRQGVYLWTEPILTIIEY